MKLESIILKTGSAVGHLVSAGLAVDAINNAVNGNYKLAAVEGIASVYIQFSKYFDRKSQRMIQDLSNFANEIHEKYPSAP